ncbi:Rrf2 family transcriptional regulator [Komagataeibacter sp. FNDCR2]|uniref:RrF2 family transcriptional regulator n=1 Tax=Komagataeibacter sp. FNDCR2 TaxID=2878682 RepID=UPI001E53C1D9|nr:Rrf2 family transcriptional regulator [Komagataeibacter sp. FNDCR2]MCE2574350.1 Rrf2 family transcriptional regulator [Komagataeibacter sp. FNDCR2]
MRLTLYTDYSLRALIYLAQNPGRRVPLHEIAQTNQISQNHLAKVINRLSSSGVIRARRGRTGGLELAGAPQQVSIGRIVRLMEGEMDCIAPCAPTDDRSCVMVDTCRLKGLFARSVEAFMMVLDCVTLSDIAVASKP